MSWAAIETAIHTWVVAASGLSSAKVFWAEQRGLRPAAPFITLQLGATRGYGLDGVDVENNPLVIADDTVESVDAGADTLTLTAHGLLTADGPVRFSTTGTLPGGLAVDTDYWLIKVDADTLKVASSFLNALDGTAINLSDTGSGTHSLEDTGETERQGSEIAHKARGQRNVTLTMQCFAEDATGTARAGAILDAVRAGAVLPTARDALRVAGVGLADFDAITPISAVVGTTQWEPRAVMTCRFFIASEKSELGTYIERAEVTQTT